MLHPALISFGDWQLKKRLGNGGFGSIALWRHRHRHEEIATKHCIRDRNCMDEDEVAKLEERWLREHEFMKNLKTDYIVRGIDVADVAFMAYLNERQGVWQPLPCIVMEYCNGGDVRKELLKAENWNGLAECEVRAVMTAVRHAVEYLHNECGINHRDLKPENILIHFTDRGRIYKLTDLGFGRRVAEHTVTASVVGTRNYIAPEMVCTGQYTRTVDYWSMGVVAFEVMCGTLPFIPHAPLVDVMAAINAKTPTCIAITEDPLRGRCFRFESSIFMENRLSGRFQEKMEAWLRLALDKDHRTRGSRDDGATLDIYTVLDDALQSRVLQMFCINTYRFHSFEVDEDMTMVQLLKAITEATGLSVESLYFVFPDRQTPVPLTPATKPLDLYDSRWLHGTTGIQKHAMVYLLSSEDCNIADPCIAPMIRAALEMGGRKARSSLPTWALKELALQTHFLLSDEQRHLEALLHGLHEYATTVLADFERLEPSLAELSEKVLLVRGCAKLFSTLVTHTKGACKDFIHIGDDFFETWNAKSQKFDHHLQQISHDVLLSLKRRHRSGQRRMKELATQNYFKELAEKDIYRVNNFRSTMSSWRCQPDRLNMMGQCEEMVLNCLEQRSKFLGSQSLQVAKDGVSDLRLEFRKVFHIYASTKEFLANLEEEVLRETAEFQKQLLRNTQHMGARRMDLSSVDGDARTATDGSSGCASIDETFNLPATTELIEDCSRQMSKWEAFYEGDVEDLPTTINTDFL